ncbi:MAG: helix-hairpin-helix domain-containing protein [Chloroflexi bacterium]|nr:helix-hairpin-helix domain-containing protein [Chloroflexota bacterium]MBP6805294.1 helix-hairpin-helix domain-containing protein [Chloroflexota bacterium]MBP7593283.1 helix-hairpin-helix domain-containing protein [Chloroflexota bacterium]
MKITQSSLGYIVLGLILGVALTLLGVGLMRQTQPAPIEIIAPAPLATPEPTATPGPIRVFVNGAVVAAAVYLLPPDSAVEQAIAAAGGFAPEANTAVINLAQPLFDGAQVYVPTMSELAATPTAVVSALSRGGTAVQLSASSSDGLIDINQADVAELDSLPGIGPSTAEKIIAYRSSVGLFKTIEEIMNVPGIGEAKFGQIKELITVSGN